MADRDEVAYAIIEPHFDAVRDVYAEYESVPGHPLTAVRRTTLLVDPAVRTSERHFAACRDDGLLIVIAPQAADLDVEVLIALICHEFGHATDFLYPAKWAGRRHQQAVWVPNGVRKQQRIRELWATRTDDQVEWDADSIAYAVTGKEVVYCGPCLIQCFSNGIQRPEGLR